MWVGSSSSLSGLRTVDFFPVFPRVFSPGVVVAPSHGFRLRRSGRLVASGSSVLEAAQSFHSVLSPRHSLAFFFFCEASRSPPLFPRSLRRPLASCLAAVRVASLPLVSRPWAVLSWSHLMCLSSVSDRFVVVQRQLVGSGVFPCFTQLPSFSRYDAAFLRVLCFVMVLWFWKTNY